MTSSCFQLLHFRCCSFCDSEPFHYYSRANECCKICINMFCYLFLYWTLFVVHLTKIVLSAADTMIVYSISRDFVLRLRHTCCSALNVISVRQDVTLIVKNDEFLCIQRSWIMGMTTSWSVMDCLWHAAHIHVHKNAWYWLWTML